MDEVIARVAAAAGVSEDVARQAVAHILAFLRKEGPAGPVDEVMAKIPGASDLAATAAEDGGGGGLLGALGGLMGGGGGIMALAGKLSSLGLGMGEMQALGRLSHPGVVRVTDFIVEGELRAIVMELLSGVNGKELVRRQGPLPVPTAAGGDLSGSSP